MEKDKKQNLINILLEESIQESVDNINKVMAYLEFMSAELAKTKPLTSTFSIWFVKWIDKRKKELSEKLVNLSKQYPDIANVEMFERGLTVKKAMSIGFGEGEKYDEGVKQLTLMGEQLMQIKGPKESAESLRKILYPLMAGSITAEFMDRQPPDSIKDDVSDSPVVQDLFEFVQNKLIDDIEYYHKMLF
jgi:hypothetical protein